jgi:nicotinate-nucleotide adenylyltransferase
VRRVGILGGAFNPPHLGHLICAQEAWVQLGLDVVVLMPVSIAPHKEIAEEPGAERRLELCRLAAEGDEQLAVSRMELDRPGPSYTVDTLRGLHERAPQDELTFIVGSDSAHSLPGWREPEGVLTLARLGVAGRAGARREEIRERLADLAGRERVAFFDMPRVDVSSSMVRRRVRSGQPIRYLVPDDVAAYIGRADLYRSQAVSAP